MRAFQFFCRMYDKWVNNAILRRIAYIGLTLTLPLALKINHKELEKCHLDAAASDAEIANLEKRFSNF